MLVKCWIAGEVESRLSIKALIALARMHGKESLEELTPKDSIDPNNISLYRDDSLVLVGGRQSIVQFLQEAGDKPIIKGGPPMLAGIARTHQLFGKNETCVKIVANRRQPPKDGAEYESLGRYIQSAIYSPPAIGAGIMLHGLVSVRPQALAGALQKIFN